MRKQTGKHVSLTTIRRLMRQTIIKDTLLAPTREIEIYLIDACKQFWSVHKRAKDLNRTRLITLDQAHAKANGTTKVSKKKTQITDSYSKRCGQRNNLSETESVSTRNTTFSYYGSRKSRMYTSTENSNGVYNRKQVTIFTNFRYITNVWCTSCSDRKWCGKDAEKNGGKQILDVTFISRIGT